MAVVLAAVASIVCVTTLLSPEHLTAIANRLANRFLEAEVTIGRVELGLKGKSPLLTVRVDDVTILSKPMLEAADRTGFPEWADSLLTLKRFEGGINVAALLGGKIDLYDVEFETPGINLLTVNDSLSNYMIYPLSPEEEKKEESSMPKISINRFRILSPKSLRFVNLATHKDFTLSLDALSIDGDNAPTYSFNLGGNFHYPELSAYNLSNMSFGMDGKVAWDPAEPTEVEITNFRLQSGCLDVLVSATVDLGNEIIVKDYSFYLYDTPIESALEMVPDSLRRIYGLQPSRFSTDIAVSVGVRSTGPMNLTTDSIPHAEIELELIPGRLRYEKIVLENVSGKLFAYLRGNDLGKATFVAKDLNIAGPATDLLFNVEAFDLTTDPLVNGSVRGRANLDRLPHQIENLINGSVRGRLTADIDFSGRQSMLAPDNFHKLSVNGDIDAYNVYYLSADTNNMLNASHACLKFGTHTAVKSDTSAAKADSMLTAFITLDSATFLHTQYSMKISDFQIGVGVLNQKESRDTTLVLPMGGDMKIGKFYLTVLGDSMAMNIRDAHGHVTMRRFKGMQRVPEFLANLDIKRISTGSVDTRFMLSGAKFNVTAHKLPRKKIPHAVKKAADSLSRTYPEMPMDSVYRRAIEIQREKHKHHGPPRIHPEFTTEETEIIDWGTSNFVRRLLLEWDIRGNLTARRAGLFTPYFPVRNRMRHFNVEFCNDSINLTNVEFKAGSSDFLLSGVISNLKRGLTSKGFRSPMMLNFDMLSDTIDVNQLADATFRGSAYALKGDDIVHGTSGAFNIDSLEMKENLSDEEFEKELGNIVVDAPDKMAPLMVPMNVDLKMLVHSKNIFYSDLMFHDFNGELLASQGSLNLNDLSADSDFGSVGLSALYSSPRADDIKFGFGLHVDNFNIHRFTKLVPAIDSIMPLLRDINGIIDAQIAATCDIDSAMNIELPTLEAAVKISGDSLELIDKETYRNIGKWLLFKDKQDNVIKHMNVELIVKDNLLTLYPFIFDIDRYKLGIQGYNDLALNFDYHVAVLKSPIPFKFGINIKGNPDHYKIRLGKANMSEKTVAQSVAIVDTARVNLLTEIQNVFRRGINNSKFAKLQISNTPTAANIDLNSDTITHADSLLFIQEGLIPAPIQQEAPDEKSQIKQDKKRKNRKSLVIPPVVAILTTTRKRKR